jgi:hypothetical protein
MSDDKSNPVDDLKQGLGLLFRAAKGAAQKLPTGKIEDVAKDAAKEMTRAFETVGGEIEKAIGRATGTRPPEGPGTGPNVPPPGATANTGGQRPETPANPQPPQPHFDDGYAPEPPKGPRVG